MIKKIVKETVYNPVSSLNHQTNKIKDCLSLQKVTTLKIKLLIPTGNYLNFEMNYYFNYDNLTRNLSNNLTGLFTSIKSYISKYIYYIY